MNMKTDWLCMASAITVSEPEVDPRPVNDNDDTSEADSAA